MTASFSYDVAYLSFGFVLLTAATDAAQRSLDTSIDVHGVVFFYAGVHDFVETCRCPCIDAVIYLFRFSFRLFWSPLAPLFSSLIGAWIGKFVLYEHLPVVTFHEHFLGRSVFLDLLLNWCFEVSSELGASSGIWDFCLGLLLRLRWFH